MATTPNINYTARDFDSLRTELINYIKLYYSDVYGDFNPNSPGMMLVDLMAYVGDILSYYQDKSYTDIFNPTEKKDVIRLLNFVNGKYKGKSAANVNAILALKIPATVVDGEIQPDEDYLPVIKKGLIASAENKQFMSIEDVDFSDETDRDILIYEIDTDQIPVSFLVKKPIKLISGLLATYNINVTDPTPFLNVSLPSNHNVLEIISLKDSFGDDWYEVGSLAQQDILIAEPNTNVNSNRQVPYILKNKRVFKKFIVETDENNITTLVFGNSKNGLPINSYYGNPSVFSVNNFSNSIGNFSFNSSYVLNNASLGISPANTVLTINYLYGGGTEYNIKANELNNIIERSLILAKPLSLLDADKYNSMNESLTILNEEQARDGVDEYAIEDLKQLIPLFYSAQNRAVTPDDFLALLYSIPNKFGNVYRAIATVDKTDSKAIALYVLSKDNIGNLDYASDELKANIKTYFERFKMLTDSINIYDGRIVNFELKFEIIAKDGYNAYEVIENVKNAFWDYFTNNKFNFGENIYISKLVRLADEVEGVLTVTDLILNASSDNTDDFNFNIKNINNIVTPDFDQIFQLKYDSGITGTFKKQ